MQFPKRKPWRSENYLNYVRGLACCACGRSPPSDAHHFMQSQPALARKVDDMFTLPLCRACHDHWHSQSYLPCFEYRVALSGDAWTERAGEFQLAHEKSIALMYQNQALLMARWIAAYQIEIPDDPTLVNDDVF